ncbi:conserved hypothetical protein [Shewanella sediminis HAW-EB3]|uniref:Uncharacterized protein n=1 Tax=Shewanella sediminis (strain HAW-EB3) TaxID=425104 RepID=A8FT03_SHESH|nr:hypothetical protein [Shewanella sediminis]ABV35976.1 conserved hypothetical protein [Shewanella sediminis HAW-EB3]
MKTIIQWSMMLILLSAASAYADDIRTKQRELDSLCEDARQEKLAPLREKYIEECVEKQGKERDYCTRFYRDYGERSGNRPAFFYDLPECVKVWEFKKSSR